jgi:putative FmdB family regulatory protein
MPIYEYKCEQCGKVNEFLILKEGDEDNLKCLSCENADLKKIMSAHSTSPSGGGFEMPSDGCCGSPGSCGTPGSCCS